MFELRPLIFDPRDPTLASRVEAARFGKGTEDGEAPVEKAFRLRPGRRVGPVEVAGDPGQMDDLRGLHVDAARVIPGQPLAHGQRLAP